MILSDEGNFEEAITEFNFSRSIFSEIHEKYGECLLVAGKLYSRLSDYEKAIEYFLDHLRFQKRLKNKTGIAQSNNLIGFEYDKLRIFSQSRYHYEEALTIFRELDDEKEICKSLAYIGNVYNFENKPESAVPFLIESLAIAEALKVPELIINPLAVFISVYTKMGEIQNALLYSSRAILLLDRISNPNMKINVLKSHGGLCVELGDYKNGIEYMREALDLAEKANNKALLLIIHKLLSNAYEANKDFSNAFAHIKLYDELREETIGKEISFKAKHLEIQYELEESIKQKQDALLSIEQREIEFNRKIWESETKTLSAKMDGHFIFNALQSIQNFLINHNTSDANEYLLKFSRLMRLILENSQNDLVPLSRDLEALELYLQLENLRTANPISYTISIDDEIDPDSILIPPLLMQPFIENSIWHGLNPKNRSGNILIKIHSNQDQLIISIEDDGVGRKFHKNVKKEHALKKQSLGIKITKERLNILSETHHITSGININDLVDVNENPIGTRVDIMLPLIQ